MHSRRQSLIETALSTLVGFFLSSILQVIFAWGFDYRTSYSQDFLAVAAFTPLSLVRGYALRRFFNWLWRSHV